MFIAALLLLLVGSSGAHAQATTPVPPAAADASSTSTSTTSAGTISTAAPVLPALPLPLWALQRSCDLVLNFSTADAAAAAQESASDIIFRGQPLPGVQHRKGYFHGNVAVVRFGGQVVVAVRKIRFHITPRSSVPDYPAGAKPDQKYISWWTSRISLCSADPATLQPLACKDYDPRNWTDCMWNGGFESLGPEDPRLIVWPSRGLFMMFVSKPWAVNPASTKPADTQCAGPWAQQPWLVPLATYAGAAPAGTTTSSTSSSLPGLAGAPSAVPSAVPSAAQQQQQPAGDPWTSFGIIRLQYTPPEWTGARLAERQRRHQAKGGAGQLLHKQKNWNPFIYNDELYFSQSFVPHVVIKPAPDGRCTKVHETDGGPLATLTSKPRGNTQAVLVPAALSGQPQPFYLGVVHTEADRRYANYFYKMQAEPPFAITAVSRVLPLHEGAHPRVPAWTHISFPMSLQLLEDTGQLMLGYGSGDQASRVRLLTLQEALALFPAGGGTTTTTTTAAAAVAAAVAGGGANGSGGGGGSSSRKDGGRSSSSSSSSAASTPVHRRSASAKSAAAAAVAAVEGVLGRRRRLGLF